MAKPDKKHLLFHSLLLGSSAFALLLSANSWSDVSDLKTWREIHFEDPDGLSDENSRAVFRFHRVRDGVTRKVQADRDLQSWSAKGADQGGTEAGEIEAGDPTDGDRDFVALYGDKTELQPAVTLETDEALYTYFSDRARDRHAREDQFGAYDHYLTFYWEDRTAAVEIEDTIPKGGETITFSVKSQWKFKTAQAELRFFYRGINTVAEYHNNGSMTPIDDTHYFRTVSYNHKEGRPLQVGDRLEFELSQFLDEPRRGRANYYGTTYLYIVGKGLVPWEARGVFGDPATELEDSYPIAEEGWLGGKTTLPYAYSGEQDGHFMQMSTNLSSMNGQPFVLGRRIHHTDFGDGSHDEGNGNPDFEALSGLLGNRYTNRSCAACHARNGRALPPEPGAQASQYVFHVGDADGNPHPRLGRFLQSQSVSGSPEGAVRFSHWEESDGLREPVFVFEGIEPGQISARIAPQLVGMGLLEAIPETTLAELADPEDADDDGISGRMRIVTDPETGDPRVGRFGWKAEQPSVRAQIAGALNADMGVLTSVYPNPDLGSQQEATDRVSRTELDDTHLAELSAYISLLGVRAQRGLDDPDVIEGQELFARAACIDCHTPTHKTSAFHPHAELRSQTIHPYTDLLLHDMGPGLADSLDRDGVANSEWRTAPLWGIGLTSGVSGGEAYLHDGRARTLEEAILWHGGEAEASRKAYEALTEPGKAKLIKFLKSL